MNDEGYLLIPRIQRRELSSYVINRFFTLRYASWWAFLFDPTMFLKEQSQPNVLPITNMRRYFIVSRINFTTIIEPKRCLR